MIEAFRLGIVPYDCVQEFIFGRSGEAQSFMDWLGQSDSSTMLAVGEYGAGKTHFLHDAYGKAIQAGYAVALVEMDANESPFHRPKRVYHQLVQTLRFHLTTDGTRQLKGFRSLIRIALDGDAFDDHIYLKCLGGRTLDETLWDWIEGRDTSVRPPNIYESMKFDPVRADFGALERGLQRMEESLREVQRLFDGTGTKLSAGYTRLPGLYPYYKAANIYCYLLSALGWVAEKVLGLKGLLLIFDEAENVDRYDNLYQADKSRNFLKALIRTANNEERLLDAPQYTGLDYCRMGIGPRIPFLYKPSSGLKLLFAWTPVDILNSFPELQAAVRVDLAPLTEKARRELLLHLSLLYRDAYEGFNEDFSHDITERIFDQVRAQGDRTRLFVKGSVEALDLIRTGVLDQ